MRLRFLRAYWVTLVVIGSYLWTRIVASVRGEAYFHRVLQEKHVANARRIQRAIVRLQGLFIKVGQTFSILTNFLPPEFRNELEGLQDSVPPRSFGSLEPRLVEEFGTTWRDRFASFDETPAAAASISQVHLATLQTGERVAVKVQYPDIDAMVASDLKTFKRILSIVSFFVPAQGLDVVYREVSHMILAELDFAEEARNIRTVTANFEGSGVRGVGFPVVHGDHCTAKILTTGFIDGVKITDRGKLKALGHDGETIARRLVEIYCLQIFVHGFYHADPHPGNVLVSADGTISLIDFGAVATIRPEMRRGIATFLQAVINQNTEKIAEALKEMGFIARPHNEEVFDRVVAYFHEKFQESITLDSFNLRDIKVDPEMGLEHLLALRKMDIGVGELSSVFQIPRDWILFERTVLLLTGLCTHLDPEIRPMELIRPYIKSFVLGDDGDWSHFLVDTSKEVLVQAIGLPGELRKFLTRASSGRLEVRLRGHERGHRLMYALGHQLLFTLVAISSSGLAAVFHLHQEPALRDSSCWVATGATVFVLLSMWRHRR